ncbi:MAG: alanine--glyoxylate aminotransferase family protein [Firmicutes bacterium]|nr:alanine--glyoxylate aminotransferase family protein [Bacillota bacterium]
MKLFTVGPTEMYEDTFEVGSKQLPYFRTNEFSKIVLETSSKMKKLLYTNEDTKLIFITGSGSAAMESIVSNSFNKEDKLLIINGGTFGARFKQISEIYNIPYETVDVKYGETLNIEHFKNYNLKEFTGMLVNIDETSTGQLYDIELLSKICNDNGIDLVVDAISSFLADEYYMDKYNIKCTVLSTQKALSISPGLSILAINNDFYERKIKNKKPINLYLNINEHVVNMERGQTPNTPAVGIILELHERIKHIDSAIDEVNRVKENAIYFRNKIKDLGLETPSFPLSNALTPIIFPNDNAKEVFEYLKNKYEIYVNPTGGEMGNKSLRVAHIGNLKKEDYDILIEKMKEVL